jgi:CubicO group peptidase (beta-lactamase class C family)
VYAAYAEKNHFPGYAYGVVVDGELVVKGSGGYINIATHTPATTQSYFRIASMSKSFTAMSILQLRDAGKLRLDDPVSLYIPEMKGQRLTADAPAITIRNLMNHAAGFPEDNPWGDRQLEKKETDLLALIKKGISFSQDPGLGYEYSNLGFTILGYVIEKVSGQSYSDYIAQHIWQPLGMQQANWEIDKVPAQQLAHGYRWIHNEYVEQPMLHNGIYGAMGGMITSVESFSKYVALHLAAWPPRNDADKGPIARASIREMHQPWRYAGLDADYHYPDGRACPMASAYTYGLRWTSDCTGRVSIGHSGGLPGYGSNWTILPDYGVGVVFFANATYAPTSFINGLVLDSLVQLAQLKPRQLPPSAILTQRRDELVKLLPDFSKAVTAPIFAVNFFSDYYVDDLSASIKEAIQKAGRIVKVDPMIPENQLRGYCILHGANADLRMRFTLTPEDPSLIQSFQLTVMAK